MKVNCIWLSVFIIIVSCGISDRNKNLEQLFSTEEIKQLEHIEKVFQNYIGSKSNCNSYNCYNKYLQQLYSFEKGGDLVIEFPKGNLKKIIENTNQNLLNEIWVNYENKRYLHLNKEGKYYEFLKLLSHSNSNVKNYIHSYNNISDYSPSLITGSIPRFINEDFSNKELRIFKAIHFISCSYKSNE